MGRAEMFKFSKILCESEEPLFWFTVPTTVLDAGWEISEMHSICNKWRTFNNK
jgi:hypothetical protein